ncbi:hypothetical protein D3C76_1881650 [compost metagenome]
MLLAIIAKPVNTISFVFLVETFIVPVEHEQDFVGQVMCMILGIVIRFKRN